MLGWDTEQDYDNACAEEAQNSKQAARACNDIMSLAQASALKLAMDALPQAGAFLAEAAFEEYGWPHDELDESWLNDAGRATWAVFKAWRAA